MTICEMVNTPINTFIGKNGEKLEIYYDELEHDIDEYQFDLKYYVWGSRAYPSLQSNDYSSFEEWYDSLMGEGAFRKQADKSKAANHGEVKFYYDLCDNLDNKGYYAWPILALEHGSIHYYFGDSIQRFDGYVAGVAFSSKRELYEVYKVKRLIPKVKKEIFDRATDNLRYITEACNGNIYRFVYYKDKDDDDAYDSCAGFCGYKTQKDMLIAMLDNIGIEDSEEFYETMTEQE